MRSGKLMLAALAPAAIALLPGCQSTQDKSREIAESLGPVAAEQGLQIKEPSREVEVVDTTLLTEDAEAAVVVELRNRSDKPLTNVPILIDVLDANGKSVYRNDIPGIEPALASVPLLKPNATVDWVNNQILATGKPKSVKVTVGASDATLTGEVPEIEVRSPEMESDPVSGTNARGVAINHSGTVNERVLIYGVVRRGGKVVAAGRAAIEEMKPDKPRVYHIFFVGDPTGGEVSISAYPTLNSA